MTFRKAVLTEAFDLLKDSFGKLRSYSLGLHSRYQTFTMALHPSGAVPCRHIPAQLIGFTGCIVRRYHRELHDLFLEKWHPQCLFEHWLEARMGKFHRFLLITATEIGMDHSSCDRSGSYDTDLNRQIVEVLWFKSWKHRHLRSAFNLEDADSMVLEHHVENPRIFSRDRGHGIVQAAVLPQK